MDSPANRPEPEVLPEDRYMVHIFGFSYGTAHFANAKTDFEKSVYRYRMSFRLCVGAK
jgi:hypothetical protein